MAPFGKATLGVDRAVECIEFEFGSVALVVNIASRCAGYITKKCDGKLSAELENPELFAEFIAQSEIIASHYENREYGLAMKATMALADKANQYIDEKKRPIPNVLLPDFVTVVASPASKITLLKLRPKCLARD